MSIAAPRRGDGRPGALWAVPALLYFALFAVVPMALVVGLSFTAWNGLGSPHWAGARNWTRLLHDPQLAQSLRLSALLTAVTWAVQTLICLPLGVWCAGHQRSRAVLSTLFFVPLLMSSAAVALLFAALLDPNFGLAHTVGPWLGVPDGNLIGDPHRALWTVTAVITWQFVPFHTLLYQAAARQVPVQLYEAATIDGADRWRQFRSVTLPQLRNTVVTSSVLILVGSLTYFDIVLILTDGGPGTSTRILPLHMYLTGFSSFDMGYASVLAVLLLLAGTTLSLLVVRVTGFRRMASQREGLS
ncbi:sugar ABC transporter permease [Streptomyces sp. V4-01]|uniref:Sugar ABC transporter permease n=1 Tax=Actinacidiphila polyblastidii TaxID=3110430 RepID=A0ABU7PC06_9ACTN|nr:sugar ABC transporter permease [Streptomyces sp. V4-01]